VLVVDFLELRDVLLLTTLVGKAESDLPVSRSIIIHNYNQVTMHQTTMRQTTMHNRVLTTLQHLLMERHNHITVHIESLRQLRKL
jgi:hypothetical protein